jgi:hypothetical protein
VEEGSGRRVLAEPYHRVRNPRAGGAIWEPSRGTDGGLVVRRIRSSLLRQTFGARRGKRRGPVAQAGPKEQQRKKSGPRRRFSGARRIEDCGALPEEQELESGGAVEKHARGGAKP